MNPRRGAPDLYTEAVARPTITPQLIADHVDRLGERHPPLDVASVDRTILRPDLVAARYGHVIDYLARVELEVDRNVAELQLLLPDVSEVDRTFYAEVWQPQEIRHGLILDQLRSDLGYQQAEPLLEVSAKIKLLGALASIKPVQEIARLLYYLTGAATERQAVLAYNSLNAGVIDLGETAISETIVSPIKQQEPGHFAFYKLSATAMIQDRVLRPWQLFLVRVLRERSYALVGTNAKPDLVSDMGRVAIDLGIANDLQAYAREVGRVEQRLLWAHRRGLDFPPYILTALRESVELYHRHFQPPAAVVPA